MISLLLAVRKGESLMSTMTGNRRRAVLWGLAGLCVVALAAGTARAIDPANVVSDRAGAILMYPKIVVDTQGQLYPGKHVDTELQITNTSKSVIGARCYMIDATHHCSNNPQLACLPDASKEQLKVQCQASTGYPSCVPPSQWQPRDFKMTLTKRQPISWKASEGLPAFPCSSIAPEGLFPCFNEGGRDGDNGDSAIIPTGDPFMGEIRCVEVDPATEQPTIGYNPANDAGGDLKGEATIVTVTQEPPAMDARKYNAIGLEARQNDGNDELILGGPDAEYAGCPNIIILDHMFEGAKPQTRGANSTWAIQKTDLTVVPCGWNFAQPSSGSIVLQFLIYNEFEQRFSTSTSVSCWRETPLSDIDTRPGDNGEDLYSIFSVYVQGTLTGQTRMRSVSSGSTANTVMAVTEEFWDCAAGEGACTDAGNVHFTGIREDQSDTLTLSPLFVNGVAN
jgi:hypothetical protein